MKASKSQIQNLKAQVGEKPGQLTYQPTPVLTVEEADAIVDDLRDLANSFRIRPEDSFNAGALYGFWTSAKWIYVKAGLGIEEIERRCGAEYSDFLKEVGA